tara:strand:- start:1343 stop:1714 length:372 start_codon:yes stop_codon:yes gene_type:complete
MWRICWKRLMWKGRKSPARRGERGYGGLAWWCVSQRSFLIFEIPHLLERLKKGPELEATRCATGTTGCQFTGIEKERGAGEERKKRKKEQETYHNPSNCSFFIFFAPEMKPRHVSAPQKQSKP